MRDWNRNYYRSPKIYSPKRKGYNISIGPNTIKAFIFIIIMLLIGWFLFYSEYLKIKNIEIDGTLNDEVRKSIGEFHGKNILIFRPGKIEEELPQKQTSIKSIKISRGIPNTLKVYVEVREPIICWKTLDKYYFIDNDGYIFEIVNEESISDYLEKIPVIEDTKNISVEPGTKFLTKDFIDFIESMTEKLIEMQKFKITALKIQETTFQIDVETDQGYKIIFNTIGNLDNQIDALSRAIDSKKDELHEYIDLRIEGRVYYK